MCISRNEIVDITGNSRFQKLIIVGVPLDCRDRFIRINEFRKTSDRFDFLLYLVFVHLEAFWILEKCFPEFRKRLHRGDDLILVIKSLTEEFVWNSGRYDPGDEDVRI